MHVALTQWVHGWAVASQQRSRRNAMVAATALTQRRMEHEAITADLHPTTTAGAADSR